MLAVKVLSLTTLASGVMAASCYNYASHGSRKHCVTADYVQLHASIFCREHWNVFSPKWINFESKGNTAHLGKVANFEHEEDCLEAVKSIVDDCHDNWVGGVWVDNGALLAINFCQFTADAEEEEKMPSGADEDVTDL